MRPHVAAVYAFARTADDFADEGRLPADVRIARLDDWRARLRAAAGFAAAESGAAGSAHLPAAIAPVPGESVDPEAIFMALGHTLRACELPVSLCEDLLSAFRQDVTTTRYQTWEDVLDYCRRSANPVGRLVLRIAGYRDALLDASSDALCTALQLTNFWQDLAIDWRRGRLYLPLSERDAAGARDADLDAGRLSPAWRAALGHAAARTRELFDQGRPVCDGVSGRLRYELRLTWLAARRVLGQLERSQFDVFANRPSLGWRDASPLGWQLVTWPAARWRGVP
jgi:phytoene synthase